MATGYDDTRPPGEQVRERREALGMSVLDAEIALGIWRGKLAPIEAGRVGVSTMLAARIEDVLGLAMRAWAHGPQGPSKPKSRIRRVKA
jgi:transcriptional regulator with XRE-family HTH domain